MSFRTFASTKRLVGMLAFGALLGLPAAPAPASDPTPIDRVSDKEFTSTLDELGSADSAVRLRAAARAGNWPADAHDRVAAALERREAGPEALGALRRVMPRLRARHGRLSRATREYEKLSALAIDAYARHAPAGAPYDEDARRAIVVGLKSPDLRGRGETDRSVVEAADRAREKGCKDPLVDWCRARAVWRTGEAGAGPAIGDYFKSVQALNGAADYPPELQCIAAIDAADDTDRSIGKFADLLKKNLPALVRLDVHDRTTYERVLRAYGALGKVQGAERAYAAVAPVYEAARPATDVGPRVLKGRFLMEFAWEARGSGYAGTVTPEGWKHMAERLALAETALTDAWAAQPTDGRAARAMIGVAMAHGTAEPARVWFDRAMAADPDYSAACDDYLYNLWPRWNGSFEQMVAFGRECVATANWRSEVPFTIVKVHEQIAKELGDRATHMRRPEVWADLRACYEGYVTAFPESPRRLSQYALAACEARQWADATRLFQRIGDSPDLTVFRSAALYDYYRRKAATAAGPPANASAASGAKPQPAVFK